jgi:hypothetical protein
MVQKSYKIMKMQMFAILDKVKSGSKHVKSLNYAAVKRTTVQVTRLPLQRELFKTGYNLFQPGLTESLYVLYIYVSYSIT